MLQLESCGGREMMQRVVSFISLASFLVNFHWRLAANDAGSYFVGYTGPFRYDDCDS